MNNLKTIRMEKNFTRRKLATAAGVTIRHICFLEDGTKNPSLKVATRIAEALEMPIEEIFLDSKCTTSTFKGGDDANKNSDPDSRDAAQQKDKNTDAKTFVTGSDK